MEPKRKNMRTLNSACQLAFKQTRRTQETLILADKVRYWRALVVHAEDELEDAEARLKEFRAANHQRKEKSA